MPKPISEVRKPEIVEAAFNAILKNGLPHISYDLIAQEADMSRQLIRHYFPDPIELMVAVCDRLAAWRVVAPRGSVGHREHPGECLLS